MAANDSVSSEAKKVVAMLGSAGCGKTALMNRAIANTFTSEYQQTFGADFGIKSLMDSKRSAFHIWCCGGHDRYRPLLEQFYKGIHVALLMFDLLSVDSFTDVMFWYNEVKRCSPDAAMILVGCKADEVDSIVIKPADAARQASEWGIEFKMTSAKTRVGIDELFEHIASLIP